MVNVSVKFSYDYYKKYRSELGNISRKLYKTVSEIEGIKLLKIDVNELKLEIPEQDRDKFKSIVDDYFKKLSEDKTKDDPCPEIIFDNEESKSLSARKKNKVEKEEREEKKEDKVEEKEEKVEVKEVKAEEKEKKVEKKEEIQEEKHPEKAEEKPEKKQEKKQEEKQEEKSGSDSILKYCQEIPMKYSPELSSYIKELSLVIPSLKNLQIKDVIWNEHLLVSINNGFGFNKFVNAVNEILIDEFGRVGGNVSKEPVPVVNITAADIETPEIILDKLKSIVKLGRVVAFDISECTSLLGKETTKEFFRKVNAACESHKIIFKLPLVEDYQLDLYHEHLKDVMNIRNISVPSLSISSMIDYIKGLLEENKFSIQEGVEDKIEKIIAIEKSDDSFYGYETLAKIANQIMYEKALSVAPEGNEKSIKIELFDRILPDEKEQNNPYDELSKMVGMSEVKEKIEEIVAQIKAQQKLNDEGKDIERPCIHMVFTGNPGTGKTTVARLVARILKNEGVLRKGQFFEKKGRDLCGRYIGETTPKTTAICRDAYGSVLFLDEAYALAVDSEKDYGAEAIATLIAEMECHKSDMCVIFAGYKDDMKRLDDLNNGFVSRIPFKLHFRDYTRDELKEIFFSMLEGRFDYENSLPATVEDYFKKIPDSVIESKNFGNGRFVRNLYERVWGKAVSRSRHEGCDKIIIKSEDFIVASADAEFRDIVKGEYVARKIGFGTN